MNESEKDYNAWLHTYQVVRRMLEDEQPEFQLMEEYDEDSGE